MGRVRVRVRVRDIDRLFNSLFHDGGLSQKTELEDFLGKGRWVI